MTDEARAQILRDARQDPEVALHLDHMTDGRWHDDCRWCRNRRVTGGFGVPEIDAQWPDEQPGEVR